MVSRGQAASKITPKRFFVTTTWNNLENARPQKYSFRNVTALAEILSERIATIFFEINIKKEKKSLFPNNRFRTVLSSFQDVLKVPEMGIFLRGVFYL